MASSMKYDRTWLEARKKAQADLYWFANRVLGYPDLYLPLHSQMVDFWLYPARHKLGLWPRGFFKSTILSVAAPLWEIIRHLPEEPVFPPSVPFQFMLASERSENTESFLIGIKTHVTRNEKFRRLFPEIRRGKPWSTTKASLQRAFDPTIKEFTFQTAGLNSDPTSTHFSHIIGDDLVGFSNYQTVDGRDFVERWWTATSPLLLPGGSRMLVMTRWDIDDIAGRIIARNHLLPEAERYHIQTEGCGWPETTTLPTVWPLEKLQAERIHQGSERFAAWMQNNPLDVTARAFREAWVKYWQKDAEFDKIREDMEIGIIVDPAATTSDTADYTATLVVGAHQGNRYVLRAEQDKIGWVQIVDQVAEFSRSYGASALGVEAVGPGAAIMQFFEAEWRKGRIPKPVLLKCDRQHRDSKKSRVRGLAPYLERGQIWIHRSHEQLLNQIRHYPQVAQDDLIDALSYVPQLLPFGDEDGLDTSPAVREGERRSPGHVIAYEPDAVPATNLTWGWI